MNQPHPKEPEPLSSSIEPVILNRIRQYHPFKRHYNGGCVWWSREVKGYAFTPLVIEVDGATFVDENLEFAGELPGGCSWDCVDDLLDVSLGVSLAIAIESPSAICHPYHGIVIKFGTEHHALAVFGEILVAAAKARIRSRA